MATIIQRKLYRSLLSVCKQFDSVRLSKAAIYQYRHLKNPEIIEPEKWFFNNALATFLEGRCFLRAESTVSLEGLVKHLSRYQFEGLPNYYPHPPPAVPPTPQEIEEAGFNALRVLNTLWDLVQEEGLIDIAKCRHKELEEYRYEQSNTDPLTLAEDLKAGTFLIQHPLPMDSFFYRSVVLIYDYQPQHGAAGLIVNKPLPMNFGSSVSFTSPKNLEGPEQIMECFAGNTTYLGGPIERLQMLHRCPSVGGYVIHYEDGEEIKNNLIEDDMRNMLKQPLFVSGDVLKVQKLVDTQKINPEDFQMFRGISCWSQGQLEREIRNGDWVVAKGPPGLAFNGQADLWKQMMKALGGPYAEFACLPDSINNQAIEPSDWLPC